MAGPTGAGPSRALTESGAAGGPGEGSGGACSRPTPRGPTPRVVAWLGRLSPDQSSAAAIVLARVLELRGAPALAGRGRSTGSRRPCPADLAKLCVRQVRASGRDEPGLIAALEKAGRLKEGAQETVGQRNEPALDRRCADRATRRGARRSFAART